MSTPVERVQEYLRQRKLLNKDLGPVIHGVFSDPNAEMADLTIGDLDAVLEQLATVQAVADDLMTRGEAIEEKEERKGNGSIYSTRAVGRGIGYREAARAIHKALQ